MAHFGRYDRTYVEVAYGDSLEASARAAREGWQFIDKNMNATADNIPIINHGAKLNTKLGGQFTHRWTGREWGEGEKVLDPKRWVAVGGREWSDLKNVTDVTGRQRLWTLETHVADGVRRNLVQMPEAKGQTRMAQREVWVTAGEMMDRHGHPRVMMTLSQYGSPLGRCKAAKAEGFTTVILPRGDRPATFDKAWRPYVDRLWGTAWGTL